MNAIHVSASRPCDVLIGRGLMREIGARAKDALRGRHVAVVSDDRVAPLYLAGALESLRAAGFQAESFVLPAGEASKDPAHYIELLRFLAERQLTRADALIALGGGVVGDLTGFAAATYLRGVDCIQIPTTLLACVDSSVGGKTAIDLPEGKNLVGAFYQPRLVLCDPDALESLPGEIFADGCAEVVKYGMLGSAELLDRLRARHASQQLEYVISTCVDMKREVVEGDEFDTGRRQLLNLGHTFAHAIERESGYQISHGRAVAMGMRLITRAAVEMGECPADCLSALDALLDMHALPKFTGLSAEALAAGALSDKKRAGGQITLAVPCGYGESKLKRVPVSELIDWARAGLKP